MNGKIRTITLALGAALLVAPALNAQPGAPGAPGGRRGVAPGPMAREGRPGPRSGITALLNARRELDLTPRQVAQLDSLERIQFTERRALAEKMRPQRDSMMARMRAEARGGRGPVRDGAARDSMRAQMEARRTAMQPQLDQARKRDSSLNAAAERLLNETQRTKVREMQAERRGFEQGLRAGRGARPGVVGAPRGGAPGRAFRDRLPAGRPPMARPRDGMRDGMREGLRGPGAGAPRRPPMDQPDSADEVLP